jgi:hypothetical protein
VAQFVVVLVTEKDPVAVAHPLGDRDPLGHVEGVCVPTIDRLIVPEGENENVPVGDMVPEKDTETVAVGVLCPLGDATEVDERLGVADTVSETLNKALPVGVGGELALPRPVGDTDALPLTVPLLDSDAALEALAPGDSETLSVAHIEYAALPEKVPLSELLTDGEGVPEAAPEALRETLGEAL